MDSEESEEPAKKKQLEEELARARNEFAEWSATVKKAIIEGNETLETKAANQQTIFLKRVEDLEKQVAALRVGPIAAPSSLKKLKKVQGTNWHDIADFFAGQLNSGVKRPKINGSGLLEGAVMEFSSHLFSDEALPQKVLIRECYKEEAKKAHEWMRTKSTDPDRFEWKKDRGRESRWHSTFVGGARGVGKSVFGALMVFEFVDEKFAVLYEHKKYRMLLFGHELHPSQRATLEEGFRIYSYDHSMLDDPGVYEFDDPDDNALFTKLIRADNLIHIQDLGDGSIANGVETAGQTRRLILSSPRNDQLKHLPKANCKYIFMPRWTEAELKQARALCYPHLTDEMVEERFAKYGGVARHVLEHTDEFATNEFKRQLKELSPGDLDHIMRTKVYNQLPSLRDVGYLIHVIPLDGTNGSEFTCVFASEYAFQEVVRVLLLHKQYKIDQFGQLLKSQTDAASLYGKWLEETAHRMLAVGGNFPVHMLDDVAIDVASGPAQRTVVWPEMHGTVVFDEISQIEDLKLNVYYRPRSKRYETIDAFVLMDGHALDAEKYAEGTIVLVLLQVTVSKKHRVNGASIKRIHEDIYKKWRRTTDLPEDLMKELPRLMIFPTRRYPSGIHQYQTLTKQDKHAYVSGNAPELPQYSLVMEHDFESVWNEAESVIVE